MSFLKKKNFLLVFILFWLTKAQAQESEAVLPDAFLAPLILSSQDVLIEPQDDGFHLFVKKKDGLSSILLTETFELPDHKIATYAFRALKVNAINGQEERLLDGQFLKKPHYSLISSTEQEHPLLGKAFHILIPPEVEYGQKGQPGSRYQFLDIPKQLAQDDQTFWFSIRAFAKPYADYTGAYKDNAFELKKIITQQSIKVQPNLQLEDNFTQLGSAHPVASINEGLLHVQKTLEKVSTQSLDLVLCIDTTKSMKDHLEVIKTQALGPIRVTTNKFKTFRLGLVFYRDYMEEYLIKSVAFQTQFDQVQKELDQALTDGGGDTPEAVMEALEASLSRFDWQAETRLIILMGDAPGHPLPRGKITETMVRQLAREKNVEIQMVLLPEKE